MKHIILPVIFSLISVVSYTQKKDITVKEYFADAEFFFVAEEYVDALQDYLEVYKRGYENNSNINYRIGVCYLNIPGQKEKSINYLVKASESVSEKYTGSTLGEKNAPLDVFLYLGNAFRVMYELDTAIKTYNKYLELLPEQASEERAYAKKQIEACQIAGEFVSNPRLVSFSSLGSLINNSNANHNCVISGDGMTMIYMSKLPFYEAVFMSKKRGKNWSRPVNITPQIMSDGDQFVTGISYNGNTLFLTKEDVFDSDIYLSKFKNGKWEKSKPIGKPINSRYWESHASVSSDGNTIYFTSNRRGGFGGMDIYFAEKLENGDWGEPQNLGELVNTELNEDTPFVTVDGKTLYFSSQGHRNMGGYDFFAINFSDSGWGGPENLQYPLSTTDDDLFYFPYAEGTIAYTHKILEEGKGNWDIYMVEFPEAKQLEEELTEQIEEVIEEEAELQTPLDIPVEKTTIQLKPILFSFDNYSLSAEGKRIVAEHIKLLNKNPNMKLKIIGHTDALGPEIYNQKLSERRALAVLKYISEKGISKDRLEAIGMGEKQFIAVNKKSDGADNPEGRKYNRRVEFEFSSTEKQKYIFQKTDIVPESLKLK